MRNIVQLAILLTAISFGPSAFAAKGGGWSLGANFGFVNADQSDINTLISRANARETGFSTSNLGNAWDISGFISYRISSSIIALQLRPSLFLQSEDGKNTAGESFDYGITAFTIFPTVRFYMLENKYIKFFSQVGIGWGFVTGEIKEKSASVDFTGNDMGYMAGLGAEFCFMGGSHCMNIEGNLRLLSVERLISSSSSGAFESNSLTSYSKGQEVELDDRDLGVSLSGIVGQVGYIYYF